MAAEPLRPLPPEPDPFAPGTPVTLTIGDRTWTGRIAGVHSHIMVDPAPPSVQPDGTWGFPPGTFYGGYMGLMVAQDSGGPGFGVDVSIL